MYVAPRPPGRGKVKVGVVWARGRFFLFSFYLFCDGGVDCWRERDAGLLPCLRVLPVGEVMFLLVSVIPRLFNDGCIYCSR